MKLYLIAGEASGDLHGSNLIREMKKRDQSIDIRCWGGDKMEAAGGTLVKHYRELAFMGYAEVIVNLGTILKNLKYCKQDILQYKPDAVVLIDYPGFNMRIAKWAKQIGLKVIFYISPTVWAWKEGRVKAMRRDIDKLIVILPFEKDYFKTKWNWDVEYVGHPLMEAVENHPKIAERFSLKPIIALLPGSRKQEIRKKLPIMLDVARSYPGYQFIVAQAPGLEEDFYNELINEYPNTSYVKNRTYDLLLQSEAALVTSGTATLETALFNVPQVVVYKTSWLSYRIAKMLIHIKYISLVNLIMDKKVVTELIQNDLTVEHLKKELEAILLGQPKRGEILEDYSVLRRQLKQEEYASAKAARSILGPTVPV